VRPLPVALPVPPQPGECVRESGWRLFRGERVAKFVKLHIKRTAEFYAVLVNSEMYFQSNVAAPRHRWHGGSTSIAFSLRSENFSPAQPDYRGRVRRAYVAEWIGTPLHEVLKAAAVLPQARYLVYFSMERDWWDTIDMEEALHPQTLLAWAMNGGDLPVSFGGPLRLRVPRQLGYKNVKFVTRLMVTDSAKGLVPALDPKSPNYGYSWYAGI
jgi:DMSO/TMAO reductase YedYZ molybdopterin-dependent catalytic subunit